MAGTCAFVPFGQTPTQDGECNPDQLCGNTGLCDGKGNCQTAADGSMCGNVCTSPTSFQPQGTCTSGVCSPAAQQCDTGETCSGVGPCVQTVKVTGTCSVDADCMSDQCLGGECCAQPCMGTATNCAATACDAAGACIYPAAGGLCPGEPSCVDMPGAPGAIVAPTQCDGNGGCTLAPSKVPCPNNTTCETPTSCWGSCTDPSECPTSSSLCTPPICVGGACQTSTAPLGAPCNDNNGVTCDATGVCQPVKFVFATSMTYAGTDIGGTMGALNGDTLCQAAAAGPLGPYAGQWSAWLSDENNTVAGRFTPAPAGVTYNLIASNGTPGVMVAPSLSSIYANGVMAGISTDEVGSPVAATRAWTGTAEDGELSTIDAPFAVSCANWTANGESGVFGGVGSTGPSWTNGDETSCSNAYPLYCFQQ